VNKEHAKRIARVLRVHRRRAGLSYKAIADRLFGEVSENTVSYVMRGEIANPGIVTVWKICDALGLSLEEVIRDAAS